MVDIYEFLRISESWYVVVLFVLERRGNFGLG